jgi:hypothetical protein
MFLVYFWDILLKFEHQGTFKLKGANNGPLMIVYSKVYLKYLKKIILKLEYHLKISYDSKRCCTIKLCKDVVTLTLGSRLKQGLARVKDKREAKEAHLILPRE